MHRMCDLKAGCNKQHCKRLLRAWTNPKPKTSPHKDSAPALPKPYLSMIFALGTPHEQSTKRVSAQIFAPECLRLQLYADQRLSVEGAAESVRLSKSKDPNCHPTSSIPKDTSSKPFHSNNSSNPKHLNPSETQQNLVQQQPQPKTRPRLNP